MFTYLDVFKKNFYRNKGQKLLLRGRPEQAYPYLEAALMMDIDPHNMYNLALAFLAMQKYDEAEAFLTKIVERAPDNALAVLTLSDLYTQRRDWDKALEIMDRLCKAYPNNPVYKKYLLVISDPKRRENYIKAKELLNKGQKDILSGNVDAAYNSLKQAVKLDPENPYIHNNLGSICLRAKNDPKKAFEHFHKAYQLNPNSKAFKENLEKTRKLIAN